MANDETESDHDTSSPSGCRWCGIEARDHFQRWKPPVGWHQWEEPTAKQRKERLLARRRSEGGDFRRRPLPFSSLVPSAQRRLPGVAQAHLRGA